MPRKHNHNVERRGRWLCIAYAFPPIHRSGTQRTLAFVRHLDRLGWDATVVAAQSHGDPIDQGLLNEVPSTARVSRVPWPDLIDQVKRLREALRIGKHRVRQVPVAPKQSRDGEGADRSNGSNRGIREWVSRLLITPDSRVGWIAPAVRRAMTEVHRSRPDVIYSTSPYMSAHLIALIVRLRTRIPWVADFRDPWRGNPFRVIESKSLNAWDALLEWCVLRRASHVIGNTPTMTRALCRRRPFVMGKCSTILNGVDLERIEWIEPQRIAPRDEFVLVHCGQFYGPRSPQPWFDALARLFRDSPVLKDRIRVVLIGPDQYDGTPLADLATRAEIGDRVSVLGMKGHDEALAYMKGSDALMLPGVDGPGGDLQVPGKLYEYLACGKPIIATATPGSPVVDIIRKAGGVAITCPIHDTAALAEAIGHVVTGGLAFATTPARIDAFDRSRTAKQLAAIFHQLSKRPLRSDPVVTATRTAPIETITGRVSRENRNVSDSSFGVVSSATAPGKSG